MLDRTTLLASTGARTDRGERIYAIGDIHGRLDLLRTLLDQIERHLDSSPQSPSVHVVLLGDLIDRGADSAGVLRFLHGVQKRTDLLVVLKGNHEELMLRVLDGEPGMMRAWMRMGGAATLRSFGIEPPEADEDLLAATKALAAAVPRDVVDWLRGLPLTARSGDYLFCHAGIRPGVPIKRQARDDLLWIREEFLNDLTDHGVVVVHGHSISSEVEVRPNRIGIDTGAYRTGVLTALCLDQAEREILTVGAPVRAGAQV